MNTAAVPDWVNALCRDEAVRALGFAPLDDARREELRKTWLGLWDQVPYDQDFHGACRARLARSTPVAEGPLRERRLGTATSTLALVLDPEEPETLWLSFTPAMPSWLWARAGRSSESLRQALAPYLVEAVPSVALPRTVRMVKPIDLKELDPLEGCVKSYELWLDDAGWGSAFDDDPWLAVPAGQGMVQLMALVRETQEQHDGRFPARAWRSLWSRSILRMEQHPFGVWVFELRYAPIGSDGVIARLNERFKERLPLDLPMDLAASLLRGGNIFADMLDELREQGKEGLLELAMACGLAPGEPSSPALLRAWIGRACEDEGTAEGLAQIALAYRQEGVFGELCCALEPGELRERLILALRPPQEDGASRDRSVDDEAPDEEDA